MTIHEQSVDDNSSGMDRRALLKKAAVTGAIAWTVPMIVSSPAFAAAVCTPKCAPKGFSPGVEGRDACDAEAAAIGAVIGTGNKIAIIAITPGNATCPCGGSTVDTVVGSIPTEFSKNNGQLVGCVPFENSPSNLSAIPYPAPGPNNTNEFVVYKQGAIGSGWYTANNPICISIACKDKSGATVYSRCLFNLCFNYSPSGSICTIFDTFTARLSAVSCSTGCTSGCS